MSTSGTVSTTVFDTRRVIDSAFRRCRLPAQSITAEMQSYAQDELYLFLSTLGNPRPPSWCIEKQVYPFTLNLSDVTMDLGTVEVLNANYRTTQQVTGTVTQTATTYTVEFASPTQVVTVRLGNSTASTLQVSADAVTWTTVGTVAAGKMWTDIVGPKPYLYFRVVASVFDATNVYLGNTPQEIPLGVLNRDTYAAQSNKVFAGRPTNYWFQRDRLQPVMHLWPAPNVQAVDAQLVVWRHRHIMDVGTLQQEIEVPQRWFDAIVFSLATRLAMTTPQVDAGVIPMLRDNASIALQAAWDGDGDGSPTYIQPYIAYYTR